MKTKTSGKDTINIVTLGCSKNLVDSEVLIKQINAGGLKAVHDSDSYNAKTVVVNTCGFINDAKQESIDTILQFAKAKEQGEIDRLFVMGCLSERYKKELSQEIKDVDQYFGTNDLKKIVESIGVNYKENLIGERHITTPGHYAYLKISEGCSRYCSFCAIPLMRGKHKSKTIDEVLKEAEFLASSGVKELMLIAQDLTYYGLDIYKQQALPELLNGLCNIDGIEWIRLHYVYPLNFPESVFEIIQSQPKMCNYIDVPFQHVSDNVLQKMRRGHTKVDNYNFIEKFRDYLPSGALRTTLMVGHPGETEKAFSELVEFVQTVKFERLGVFTYSEEEGTYGARNHKDSISEKEKIRRKEYIMDIQQEISLTQNSSFIGQSLKCIVDRKEQDFYIGRTEFDSPEVDNEVIIKTNKKLEIGNFYNVNINNSDYFDLIGTL